MKKFLLYFLFVLCLVAVGTFSFGFWNAKKIQNNAREIAAVRARHDLIPQIDEVKKNINTTGKKDTGQIRAESKSFEEKLGLLEKEAAMAKSEIEKIPSSRQTNEVKNSAIAYYAALGKQANDLKGIAAYMNQLIETADIFSDISESSSLDEMKSLIAGAKDKSASINTDFLAAALQIPAKNLRDSMNAFLIKIDDVAALKSDDSAELDARYQDFSQKENEFFSAEKKFIDEMENLDIMEQRISEEIRRAEMIKFSL